MTVKKHIKLYSADLMNAIDALIIVLNPHGKIVFMNRACEELTGFKLGDVEGKVLFDIFIPPEEVKAVKAVFANLVADQENSKCTNHWRTADGGERLISWSNTCLKDPKGKLDYIVGTGIDITISQQQEEKVRRAQKVEAIGQLTGGIAHDFNNLLTIILGNLEVLEGSPLNPEAREILKEVFDAIEQGSELVSQLLALGRRQSLSPKIVNISKIVQHLMQLLRRTLPENIEIITLLEHDLWQCHADPGQIENALLNVILNARDAMPNGGKITIKTAHVTFTPDDIPVDLEIARGDYCELRISDTGLGMPAHVLERAIDPFFTTKSTSIGTGLGLSMVHGFIEQSSGGMRIESQEGVGTTVSLYLPRSDEKILTTGNNKAKLLQPDIGGGQKILHVEDDPRVRLVNTRRLKSMGFEVLTAKDAPTALEILSKHSDVDAVFSDIVMLGGMTGIELEKKVHSLYPNIKILLTTGYSKDIFLTDNDKVNIIKKPFSKNELQARLQEVLAN